MKNNIGNMHGPNESQVEGQWKISPGGKIFHYLQSKYPHTPAEVLHKGGIIEIFIFGKEKARLVKKPIANSMHEDLEGILHCAEIWEYEKYPWWKEALEQLKVPLEFLHTPLFRAAEDGNIQVAEQFFCSIDVVKNLLGEDYETDPYRPILEKSIRNTILEVGNKVLYPDFHLEYSDQTIRLIPLSNIKHTNTAIQVKFQRMVELLEKEYQKLKEKL